MKRLLIVALVSLALGAALGCGPSDPRLQVLEERARWNVELLGFSSDAEAGITISTRISGPVHSKLEQRYRDGVEWLVGVDMERILRHNVADEREQSELSTLGLLDITVRRTGYGRQVDSFETRLDGVGANETVAFIRAPQITRLGPGVEALASLDGNPVAVRGGLVSALTFHPEVTGAMAWHREWLSAACTGVA